MNTSLLAQQTLQSPLSQQTLIDRSKEGKKSRVLAATLILTSLVDVFSILVIYLLVNTSASTETLDVSKTLNLPVANNTNILESSVVVRISKQGIYSINDKDFKQEQLAEALLEQNSDPLKKGKLVIQADQDIEFDTLNPVFVAGAHAGFSNIKFAVWPDGQPTSSVSEPVALKGDVR